MSIATLLLDLLLLILFGNDSKQERKVSPQTLKKTLEDGVMEATMVVVNDGQSYTKKAVVHDHDDHLSLVITSNESGTNKETHKCTFASQAELEHYLTMHTDFRIGDFIRHLPLNP